MKTQISHLVLLLTLLIYTLLSSTTASSIRIPIQRQRRISALPSFHNSHQHRIKSAAAAAAAATNAKHDNQHDHHRRTLLQVDDALGNPATFDTKNYTTATASGTPGVLLLTNYYNSAYQALIDVGTPSQPMLVTFDTGSSDLWVVGTAAPNDTFNHFFDGSQSSTFVNLTEPWYVHYAVGDAYGSYVRDTVKLANLTVTNTVFGVAYDDATAGSLPVNGLDGVMGLAYQNLLLNTTYNTTLQNMYSQGQIDAPMFSFVLSKTSDSNLGTSGNYLLFGTPHASLTPFGVAYAPIVDPLTQGYYLVALDGIAADGSAVVTCGTGAAFSRAESCYAIVDSGTTLITFPTSAYESFVEGILSTRPDCNVSPTTELVTCQIYTYGYAGLPTLTFTLAGTTITLQPVQYFQDQMLAIQPLDGLTSLSDNAFLLGDVFLQSVYTIFDQGNGGRVGFAMQPPANSVDYSGPLFALDTFSTDIANSKGLSIVNPTIYWNPPDVSTFLVDFAALEAAAAGSNTGSSSTQLHRLNSVKKQRQFELHSQRKARMKQRRQFGSTSSRSGFAAWTPSLHGKMSSSFKA